MDADTNVESLSFSLDGLAKKTRDHVTILDHCDEKDPDPHSNSRHQPVSSAAGTAAHAAREGLFRRRDHPSHADRGGQASFRLHAGTAPTRSAASGSLNVPRYGRMLRARMLVGVRGAGLAYDGLYYVDSVTHSIKRGEYKQNFQLSRDGLISQHPGGAAMTAPGPAKRFYGKYRATVIQNVDPEQRGRLQLMVPDVFGADSVDLGRGVHAARRTDRTADGRVHRAADRRRRLGRVRAGRSATTRSGPAVAGAARRTSRRLPRCWQSCRPQHRHAVAAPAHR